MKREGNLHMGTWVMGSIITVSLICLGINWWSVLHETHKDLSGIDSVGYQYIDLALPSGTLWASYNIGATKPDEYGDYFAWGEISPKEVFDDSTYKWGIGKGVMAKYNAKDGLTTLLSEDDAATANWGTEWRMPTIEEIRELEKNCRCCWTEVNGVKGATFTARNGNSIFFPAAGDRVDSVLYFVGDFGAYWSSSLYSLRTNKAWALGLWNNEDCVICWEYNRIIGKTVRAVRMYKNK